MRLIGGPALRRRVFTALGILALGLVADCKHAPGNAVVWVDTDIPPSRFSDLFVCSGLEWDGHMDRADLEVRPLGHRSVADMPPRFPASFGVSFGQATMNQRATIVITDRDRASGDMSQGTVRRIMRFRVPEDGKVRINVVLNDACQRVHATSMCHPCPGTLTQCSLTDSCDFQGQTCGNEGVCRSIDLADNELLTEDVDGGWPDSDWRDATRFDTCPGPTLDAGTPDGTGRDAATDGPPQDMRMDAPTG